MKNQAFTLIELLVVVLIIGILAAIAVPQYSTATKLSRIKGYLTIAKELNDAQEIYYLTHGTYSNDISKLDATVDYISKEDIEYDTYTRTKYETSFGGLDAYTHIPTIDIWTSDGVIINFYGLNKRQLSNQRTDINIYGVCYGDDKVCSKFGGEIWLPGTSRADGTNVYYMTTI